MEVSQVYKNAFTEVYTILDYIEDEDYKKIPQNVLDVIEENMNMDYEYEMNEDVDIYKQPMLPETKAILFNFYRDYWSSQEQSEKIKQIQSRELLLDDEQKKKKYDINVFNSSNMQNIPVKDEEALAKSKQESFFMRIINKIKNFFGKNVR